MPSSMALTLRANILAQQWATGLGKGVSAADPNIRTPGTEAYQKYQAAIRTAKVASSQIANQRDLAAVTVSYAAQSICSGNATHTFLALFECHRHAPRAEFDRQHQPDSSDVLLLCMGQASVHHRSKHDEHTFVP